jgi:exopolyphosphatase/guanosine-5'-triphosphate,3'-diphosphate pyrophosphatase
VVSKGSFIQEDSLPLGTGRVLVECGLRSPCSNVAKRAAESYIEATLESSVIEPRTGVAVVCGGVARGLWRALHPDGEKLLAIEEIEYMAWVAARLPIDRIITRFGVKTRRAGTLLPGALIYRALMRRFGLNEIIVSEFGIREGAVLGMASGEIIGCPV